MADRVKGTCPACGNQTLRYAASRLGVVCTTPGCPRPSAVNALLAIATPEHEVELRANGFSIKHPMIERIDDALFNCPLHAYLTEIVDGRQENGDLELGRYWVREVRGEWTWREA